VVLILSYVTYTTTFDNLLHYFEFCASIFTILGYYLASKKSIHVWHSWVISGIIWSWVTLSSGLIAISLSYLAFNVIYLAALRKWHRDADAIVES
jgi:nicotinamide riboside transporter PnuC